MRPIRGHAACTVEARIEAVDYAQAHLEALKRPASSKKTGCR